MARSKKAQPKRKGPQPGSQLLPVYPSMAVCQAATGIPISVLAAAKAAGCAGFRFARIYLSELLPALTRCRPALEAALDALPVPAIAPWQGPAATPGQLQLIPDVVGSPRQRWESYKAEREKIRLLQDHHLIVDKTKVEQDVKEILAVHFQLLERIFCSELPPKIVGLRELQIRAVCRESVQALIDQLRTMETITSNSSDERKSDEPITESAPKRGPEQQAPTNDATKPVVAVSQ